MKYLKNYRSKIYNMLHKIYAKFDVEFKNKIKTTTFHLK